MFKLNRYKPYIPFARNVFQRLISYKANVLFFMFGDLLMLAVTYYLWKAIYESSNESILNGFGFNEMIIYIFIHTTVLLHRNRNLHHIIKKHRLLIRNRNPGNRRNDPPLLHLTITKAQLLHEIDPGLFHPFHIIGMMDDPHLICLMILCLTPVNTHVYILSSVKI